MTGKEHNKLVGIMLLAHGALQGLVMILLALFYGVFGAAMMFGAKGEAKVVGLVFLLAIFFIVFLFLIFVVPQLLGGWKVFKEGKNARFWGTAGSIVSLLNIPLGTAVGIYGLWFLQGDEGKRFYNGGSNMMPPPPPPPQSWQQQ